MKKSILNFIILRKIRLQVLLTALFFLTGISGIASQGPVLFDMGNDTSAVSEGFTRVTKQNIYERNYRLWLEITRKD